MPASSEQAQEVNPPHTHHHNNTYTHAPPPPQNTHTRHRLGCSLQKLAELPGPHLQQPPPQCRARHAGPTKLEHTIRYPQARTCVTCTRRSRSANMPASVQHALSSAPDAPVIWSAGRQGTARAAQQVGARGQDHWKPRSALPGRAVAVAGLWQPDICR
jgi:hypothetical protein